MRFIKIMFIVLGVVVITSIVVRIVMISRAKGDNNVAYHIQVNSYGTYESYVTKNYTKDRTTGCIEFIDELGLKRTVCNSYTITEY